MLALPFFAAAIPSKTCRDSSDTCSGDIVQPDAIKSNSLLAMRSLVSKVDLTLTESDIFLSNSSTEGDTFLSSTKAGPIVPRFFQFVNFATTVNEVTSSGFAEKARGIQSSGGVAGGVITEGQGYGLLIGGVALTSMSPTDPEFEAVLWQTYEMYVAWKHMARLSATGKTCQTPFHCGASCPPEGRSSGPDCYPCLPHWKFAEDLSNWTLVENAPDGDEDAILGLILFLRATAAVKDKYAFWPEVAKFTYQSCKQFMVTNFEVGSGGNAGLRLLKLGACWGGFKPECNNPSYHAPGAFRVMRDFMIAYDEVAGSDGAEGDGFAPLWNEAVRSSYLYLKDNQCASTGLTTNWFRTGDKLGEGGGDYGCSGSGTKAKVFGNEAARGVWRVALDALWYSEDAAGPDLSAFGPSEYLERVTKLVAGNRLKEVKWWDGKLAWNPTLVTETVCDVVPPGVWNDQIQLFSPVVTALVRQSNQVEQQQELVDAAGFTLSCFPINHYYSGSWLAIATAMLNGDFGKAGKLVRDVTPAGKGSNCCWYPTTGDICGKCTTWAPSSNPCGASKEGCESCDKSTWCE